jgi:sterol desaturase/sphingolipid hydroxylase (fatty acid hydroxylase superfamily)
MDEMEIDGQDWSWAVPTKNAIVVLLLAALWAGESIAPMFAVRRRRLSHGAANVALGVVNGIVGSVLFGGAILVATEWSRENSIGLLHHLPRMWPAWIQFVIGLVLVDLWMYWWHRINHSVPLLWRFHAVHHSDRELDATSAVRFHTGEIVFSGIARLLVLPLLGVSLPMLWFTNCCCCQLFCFIIAICESLDPLTALFERSLSRHGCIGCTIL